MSGAQSYIVRILRKLEAAVEGGDRQPERLMVGRLVHRISHAEDVDAALEHLYCVRGYDQFALRLMWLCDHAGEESNRLESAVIDYDVETLIAALPVRSSGNGSASPAETMESFHEQLHRFGRVLEEVKRRSFEGEFFKGTDENSLYQVLAEAGSLQQAARAVGQEDVVRFSTACSGFVQYALDRALLQDVRVINMLEHANLTLQTILAAAGSEEYDSLQKSVELLQNPKEVLE